MNSKSSLIKFQMGRQNDFLDSDILENTGTYQQISWSQHIDQGLTLGDHVD